MNHCFVLSHYFSQCTEKHCRQAIAYGVVLSDVIDEQGYFFFHIKILHVKLSEFKKILLYNKF